MFALVHLKPDLGLINTVSKIADIPIRPNRAPESYVCSGSAMGMDPREPSCPGIRMLLTVQ